MSRKGLAAATLVLALAIVVLTASLAAQKKAARLVADNRTAYVVELHRWDGAKWTFVSRVAARSWQQFPNVPAGSVWRASFGRAVREHKVAYKWYPDYNGYQDVWVIH